MNINPVDLTLYKERINTGTSWTRNKVFDTHGYLVIKDLYDPVHLYHPVPQERGLIRYDGSLDKFEHIQQEDQVVGSLSRYHHPQYKQLHHFQLL